jgi:glycogen synthase
LSHYQSQTNYLESWIILPHYSFIKATKEDIFTDIIITYDEKKIQVPIYKKQFGKVLVFLIGFKFYHLTRDLGEGDEPPFDRIFDTTLQKLYATPSDISSSLREGYFSVCSAKLIIKLWKGNFNHLLDFQGKKIDFVHIHGSTNGLVPPILHFSMGKTLRPTIIYTMHDYSSEPWSLIKKKDLESFSIPIPNEINFKSNVIALSPLGLENSDAITCVSRTMREEIVNGVVYFSYRDIILNRKENFIGVPNAVADEMQPFNHIQLK